MSAVIALYYRTASVFIVLFYIVVKVSLVSFSTMSLPGGQDIVLYRLLLLQQWRSCRLAANPAYTLKKKKKKKKDSPFHPRIYFIKSLKCSRRHSSPQGRREGTKEPLQRQNHYILLPLYYLKKLRYFSPNLFNKTINYTLHISLNMDATDAVRDSKWIFLLKKNAISVVFLI